MGGYKRYNKTTGKFISLSSYFSSHHHHHLFYLLSKLRKINNLVHSYKLTNYKEKREDEDKSLNTKWHEFLTYYFKI